jgi:hypothetical protein
MEIKKKHLEFKTFFLTLEKPKKLGDGRRKSWNIQVGFFNIIL